MGIGMKTALILSAITGILILGVLVPLVIMASENKVRGARIMSFCDCKQCNCSIEGLHDTKFWTCPFCKNGNHIKQNKIL